MNSTEDELGLGRPMGRLLNRAALLFFSAELAGADSNDLLGAEMR